SLREPGRLTCLGEAVDLSLLDMPAYLVATREDHIVPWRTAFASTQLLGGPVRFVLGASGHIAGIVNPPARRRRSFWSMDDDTRLPDAADAWLAAAAERPGSWWTDWTDWIAPHRGRERRAPRAGGSAAHRPLGPAPGEYVKVRA
ncbi:MAG: class I poly(R)-hydroxyalkanoic acid synthase, partial [Burkholderiales bacterium]|nr:class I poly(R)-hydroxyalkanoic acid synthase [Burkholderiales bacterium]